MKAFLAALCVGLVALTGCTTGDDAVVQGGEFFFVAPGGKTEIFYDLAERKALPAISGEDLFAEDKTISTTDFAGKVVVVNIWGQWCGPCRREAPALQEVYEQTEDAGVQMLGIDVRDPSRQAPQDFMRDRGLTYPSIYDPPGRSLLPLKGYPKNVVPSTIVLDRQHRVAAVFLKELLATDLIPVVARIAAE
ncbi:MAG: TlpA disulfide reductase family protein [Haloechinothrix sp.]